MVRRLTPRECERLQGFPDDWTAIGADGRRLSDSARYRAMGNAVTVPVIAWIGARLLAAHHPTEPARHRGWWPVSEPLPLSVWATAQQLPRTQRAGRYVARHAPPTRPRCSPPSPPPPSPPTPSPGSWSSTPCAASAPPWSKPSTRAARPSGSSTSPAGPTVARANLTLAAGQGATGTGQVHTGDARHLLDLLDPALHGTAALVLTSPPYGASVHGQVSARPGQGVPSTTTATRPTRPTSPTPTTPASSQRSRRSWPPPGSCSGPGGWWC